MLGTGAANVQGKAAVTCRYTACSAVVALTTVACELEQYRQKVLLVYIHSKSAQFG
jgi:hypothetical protein